MSVDPRIQALLAPLNEPEDALASRRVQVDREKIVSRMVEVSLAPEERFGRRARVAAALALAAGFALAAWGGRSWWQGEVSSVRGIGIEVVAVRGNVTGVQGATARGLGLGQPTQLSAEGTLETSAGAEARIKTRSGMVVALLENTKVSLGELLASDTSSALRLERGSVRCVIPHQPGRRFSVITSAARVVDVGTTFSVSIEPTSAGPRTRVQVEEGEVLIEYVGGQSRLTAAQSWMSARPPLEPSVEPTPTAAALEPAPPPQSPRREMGKRRPETLAAETKLLRGGLSAEQKGDLAAARQAFEALVRRYPESQLAPDAKAALARVQGRLESLK